MRNSKIILLNGVSSSGKSTIARALQKTLPAPYLHVCIDSFEEMMPERYDLGGEFGRRPVFGKMLSGFHHSIAALARCGNNLIVDHVLVEGEVPLNWASECLSLLTAFDVFLVGVRCSLEDLERRERERGDRPSGLARWQYTRMHQKLAYDLEVDTSLHSAEEIAGQIICALSNPSKAGLAASLELLG